MIKLDPGLLVSWFNMVVWPFVRIGAMLMAAPIFGAVHVSVRVRVLLALSLALLIAPMLPAMPNVSPVSPGGFLITAQEATIGVMMGFMLQLVFAAVVLMGQLMGMSMGLGFAVVVDPNHGSGVPVLGQFFTVFATLIFLGLNGHIILISTLVDSFHTYPVGSGMWSTNSFMNIALLGRTVFSGAILMALPVLTAVLLVNLSLGVITRTAPQLNIFAIGFPITIAVGLVTAILALPAFSSHLVEMFDEAFQTLMTLGQ